jgi:multicomponent Na+:H+ antiporter subunit E
LHDRLPKHNSAIDDLVFAHRRPELGQHFNWGERGDFAARGATNLGLLKDWLRTLWEVVVAVPQAYKEAIEIMLYPHHHETVTLERAKPRRTPSLIFLDIFLITFTPKTIVQRYHSRGWYEVHYIQRRETP